jgi:hypothetical protein
MQETANSTVHLTHPLPHNHLTESCHCTVLLEAPENAQSHVTYLALHLSFNFIIWMTFHCHCVMKWNYDIQIHYEFTENWMHSVPQLQFGFDRRKSNIFLQLQWKGLVLMCETKDFLSSFFWIPILSLICPSALQLQISEEYSKNVNFMNNIAEQGF